MTNLYDPCDPCGVIDHNVVVIYETFTGRDGQIWPPSEPELGGTLDYEKLERFRRV